MSDNIQDQLLLEGARHGDIDGMQQALDNGANVNSVNIEGNTPLLLAIGYGTDGKAQQFLYRKAANLLLDNNSDTKLCSTSGESALDVAIMYSKQKAVIVEDLLARGITFPTKTHKAAYYGNLSKLEEYYNSGIDMNPKTPCDFIPLHYAIANGQLKTVAWLIKEKISSPHVRDARYGATLLFWASWNNQLDVVKFLLSPDGRLKSYERDGFGATALLWASSNGRINIMNWLLTEGGSEITERNETDKYVSGLSPLLLAALGGQLEAVKWLLSDGGSKIDERNSLGYTALLIAASTGWLDTVRWLLIEGGANINEANNDGQTALMIAKQAHQLDVVRWLETCEKNS